MHNMLKRKKNYTKKIKSKKNQNTFKYGCKLVSRRCGSYRMYLEGNSPHLAMFFTHNTQNYLLLLIHMQVQCDLAITKNTCVNVCSLNCLDLFLKYKIG